MSSDLIQQYYDQLTKEEWERLERHPMEFAITQLALKEWLPTPPAEILDCGSGPGRYALMLAQQGYQISLLDLSAVNIEYAITRFKQSGLNFVRAEQGNAIDLSRFPAESFDAVLMFGPLYHSLNRSDRLVALAGVLRVLRPGGLLFAAFISRYALVRSLIRNQPELILDISEQLRNFWDTGTYSAQRKNGNEFIFYAIHPTEIAALLESSGFRFLTLLGLEGLTSLIDENLNQASTEIWNEWVQLNYQVADDPSILGCTEHLLAVARKRY